MEEENENLTFATLFNIKEKKKKKKKKKTKANKESERVADDSATAANDEGGGGSTSSGANPKVSLFDISVENFFEDMDTIAKLCGEEERNTAVEQSEIKRMFSSVTFLRYDCKELIVSCIF
jgi:general transcription factor 3C polypeptide 2